MPDAIDKTVHIDGKCRSHPIDARIALLAANQFGVVGRDQLLDLELSADAIDTRLKRGRLHRVYAGAYAVGHPRIAREGRWLAATLATKGVLSHRSAAALWGIRPYSGRPEVTVAPGARRRAGIDARRSSLHPDEIKTHTGIRTTTPARTLIDLAALLGEGQLSKAIREADFLGLFDLRDVERLIARHRRRRGIPKLRDAVGLAAETRGHTRSALEDLFLTRVRDAGLPMPEVNALVDLGAMTIEVDALWRDRRLIVELDGWQAHRTRHAFENDRQRDLAASLARYTTVRLTWQSLQAALPDRLRRLVDQ